MVTSMDRMGQQANAKMTPQTVWVHACGCCAASQERQMAPSTAEATPNFTRVLVQFVSAFLAVFT